MNGLQCKKPSVDTTRIADWLSRLVQVPSVTPSQAGPRAGTPGEAAIGKAVAGWFSSLGGQVQTQEVLPGRHNVIGLWQGSSDRLVAVDAHLDTVGVETMVDDPFSGKCAEEKVFGRGATDTKATLAVVLATLEAIQRDQITLGPSVLIAATVDEEVGGTGAPALARWLSEQALVVDELAVAEPTHCGPVYGHKGVLRMAFEVEGVAAHSSQPELGRNALNAAARIVITMQEENDRLIAMGSTHALGTGSLTVTQFEAGEGVNVVPPRARLSIDRRLTAGEDAAAEQKRLESIAVSACPLPVKTERLLSVEPFVRDPASPWMQRLAGWSGMSPQVVPFGTNAWAYPKDVARDCAVIGPGSIEQAHGKTEWINVSELRRMADILALWWGLCT